MRHEISGSLCVEDLNTPPPSGRSRSFSGDPERKRLVPLMDSQAEFSPELHRGSLQNPRALPSPPPLSLLRVPRGPGGVPPLASSLPGSHGALLAVRQVAQERTIMKCTHLRPQSLWLGVTYTGTCAFLCPHRQGPACSSHWGVGRRSRWHHRGRPGAVQAGGCSARLFPSARPAGLGPPQPCYMPHTPDSSPDKFHWPPSLHQNLQHDPISSCSQVLVAPRPSVALSLPWC